MSNMRCAIAVDDDPVYLESVGLMLRKIGFAEVRLFCNAFDALDWLDGHIPDLIVSDWDMPLMTGREFLEEIRGESSTRTIPFILNTGNESQYYLQQAYASGATDFLNKPYSFAQFRESVRRALEPVGNDNQAREQGKCAS